MQRLFCHVSFLLAVASCAGRSSDSFAQTITAPATVQATFTAATCAVGPDGSIQLAGALTFDGLDARIIFRNNQKGTHENVQDLTATTVVIPDGQTLVIPAPSLAGMAGVTPLITVQFFDAAGHPLSGAITLGACGAGFAAPASAAIALDTTVTLTVSVDGCSNHPGPTITVEGSVKFAGLTAHLAVRAADGSQAGALVTGADVVALGPGKTLAIPKQPSRGGAGGNPWIFAQLVDTSGNGVTDEVLVGRCVAEGQDEMN